ncbi:MAG: hypothetical protein H6733_15960, partial [Alphaproteobacteria bacterium]|nr:hypothetical protein [Alphaproteobacteria bacterium]
DPGDTDSDTTPGDTDSDTTPGDTDTDSDSDTTPGDTDSDTTPGDSDSDTDTVVVVDTDTDSDSDTTPGDTDTDSDTVVVVDTDTDSDVVDTDTDSDTPPDDSDSDTPVDTDGPVDTDDTDGGDRDGDGIPDDEEPNYGTDPDNPDTDGDGFPDGLEVLFGTDPLTPDGTRGGAGCDGCHTGGGPGGAAWLLLLPLALLRRRRRTAAVLAATAAAASAAAQETAPRPQLDIQRFDPTPQVRGWARLRDGALASRGTYGGFLAVNYGLHPYELGSGSDGSRSGGLVDHLVGFDVGFEAVPLEWLSVAFAFPFLQIQSSSEQAQAYTAALGGSGKAVGVGDLTLAVGFAPVRESAGMPVSLSLVPRFVFPTGSRGAFVGSGAVGIGVDAALSKRWTHLHLAANLGYQLQTSSSAVGQTYADDELRWGLGLGVPIADGTWEIQGTWTGAHVVTGPASQALAEAVSSLGHTPMELDLAATWAPYDQPVYVTFGVSPGLTHGFGTPDVRAWAMVGVAVGPHDALARTLRPTARDADGDGIPDDLDLCVGTPEDEDGFEDEDGCPEQDRDGDGILDVDDACPGEPEDRDGWRDGDGCPDPDNDGDGIPDGVDGHRTLDGVAVDPSFPLRGDCANDPETFNDVDDDDGCPDVALVALDGDTIRTLEPVRFRTHGTGVDVPSLPVLESLAELLASHPELTSVAVQVGIDPADPASNDAGWRLSRADEVAGYLVAYGVDAARLVPTGDPSPPTPGQVGAPVRFQVLERAPSP